MNIYDRYTAAVADLAAQGIAVVLDTTALTAGDAWTKHAGTNNGRVAVASQFGGLWYTVDELRYREGHREGKVRALYFGHPYTDLSVASALVAGFEAQGFNVEWDGDPETCVTVHLAA